MRTLYCAVLVLAVLGGSVQESLAQHSADEESQTSVTSESVPARTGPIATSNSVPDQIRADAHRDRSQVWKDFKKQLLTNTGFIFGADYILLPQVFNESLLGPNASTAGIFRIFGHWTPSKKMTPGAGHIVFKFDHRHKINSEVPATVLAARAGVATSTAPVYNDAGFLLTNLYWSQGLADNRFSYRVGVVDATEYVDVSILMNAYTEFSDIAFSFNPTIPAPKQGLGALVRWSFTPNYYVMGGLVDANSDPHRPDTFFDTFGEGEYLSHVSFGWVGSYKERRENNNNIVFWYENRKPESETESGWGVALNLSRRFNQWEPFFKAGYSDIEGTLVDRSVSVGVGYEFSGRKDFWAIGANWGRVPDNSRNQFLFETYYRIPVFNFLQFAPHVHYFINPAFDPNTSSLWMLSVKLRLSI